MGSLDGSQEKAATPAPENQHANIDLTHLVPPPHKDLANAQAADTTKNSAAAADKPMTPSQVADSLIKNHGFGNGEDREKINNTLGKVTLDDLKNGDGKAAKEFAMKVNEELAKKGADIFLGEKGLGGGGSGGRGKDGQHESSAEEKEAFSVYDKGHITDVSIVSAATDKVTDKNGKVIGEHESVSTDTGGGGGGKGPVSRGFQLHEMNLHDPSDTGHGGGGGGGGQGGSKGGKSPMGG